MIYGRVIGNELRDVPPECLPVWGQRWSGYRAPHGPSPFSTRVFSVDRMSEVGPALTSPTQFEMTLTDEDEGDDTSSESSRLYNSFSSSAPLAIQTGATELTSRPKTPTPRSVHRLSNPPHGSPQMLHRSTGHPPLPSSTCFSTTLLPGWQSEQSGVHHASKPLLHPRPLHYRMPIQGGRGSFENDPSLWDMDRTSTGTQPRTGPSHASLVPTGQLQHTMPPYSVPEWQFANAYTQSSVYPFQPNPSSHPDSGYLFQPFPDDDQTSFIPTTPPSASHCFTMPLLPQIVGIDSSWNHESGTTRIPGITHTRTHMTAQWPSGSFLPCTLQTSGSSLSPTRVFYHLVSDHGNSSHPEDLLDTFPHAEGCTLLSLEKPGDDQCTR